MMYVHEITTQIYDELSFYLLSQLSCYLPRQYVHPKTLKTCFLTYSQWYMELHIAFVLNVQLLQNQVWEISFAILEVKGFF